MREKMFKELKYKLKRTFYRYMSEHDITLEELRKKQIDGAEIIDVRNKREYEESHIQESINIPEYEINENIREYYKRQKQTYSSILYNRI